MKKLLISTLAVASLFAANSNNDVQKEIEALKAKIAKLEKQVKENKNIALNADKKASPFAANDHLYWSYSLQSNFDFVDYKLQNGDKQTNNILSNRVALEAIAKPNDNLKGNLRLVAYNIYGMNAGAANLAYDNSNWTASETPDDTILRVQEAYFNWFFGDGKYMLSTGRRPSTEGYPANLRDNVRAESPIAHLVNMEFDGISFWIKNDFFADLSDKFSDWGTNLKFCFGRGYSSSTGKFSPTPYGKDTHKITDFGGFLFVPYNDGQYSIWWEQIWAWNMKGYNSTTNNPLDDLGSLMGTNIIFKADGIGDEISDFLDNSKAFISWAYTRTNPKSNKRMLGSSDSKSGWSIWIGGDFPASEENNDRWGFNFVHGSKYYRAMTYGEDTLIGSIAATRGNAYEVYYHHYLLDNLTAGIRATYIKYDYTGSNAFFGDYSKPVDVEDNPNAIKHAMDIRAYIRYSF